MLENNVHEDGDATEVLSISGLAALKSNAEQTMGNVGSDNIFLQKQLNKKKE